MIVVDENLRDPRIIKGISTWYRGQVIPVTTLRPNTIVKDDLPLIYMWWLREKSD